MSSRRDDDDAAAQKLGEMVATAWQAPMIRPGSSGTCVRSPDSERSRRPGTPGRDEARSAAWRRFLEAIAESGPTVLVFEDLHWADDGLLDFVDHLADWTTGIPLLVVCTACPSC